MAREGGTTRRRGRAWVLVVLALLLAAPMVPSMRLDQMPAARAAQDLMHVPLAATMVLALGNLLAGRRRGRTWAALIAAACLLGIEGVQGWLALGNPSLRDVMFDAIGLAGALVGLWMWPRLAGTGRLLALVALAAAMLVVPGTRLAGVWRAEQARLHRLPVLADFEDAGDLAPWRGTGGMTIARQRDPDGGHVLHCRFEPGERPAVVCTYLPEDWSGYSRLVLRIRSLESPSPDLTLKVTDLVQWRDFAHRHTRPVHLDAEWTTVAVDLDSLVTPSGRVLDRSRMNTLVFFLRDPAAPGGFVLDDLRLER